MSNGEIFSTTSKLVEVEKYQPIVFLGAQNSKRINIKINPIFLEECGEFTNDALETVFKQDQLDEVYSLQLYAKTEEELKNNSIYLVLGMRYATRYTPAPEE